MEEMLDSAFIANEAKSFVNQETRNRTAGHTYSSDTRTPLPSPRRTGAPRTDPGPDGQSRPSPCGGPQQPSEPPATSWQARDTLRERSQRPKTAGDEPAQT
jgi:hypothetical protein